LYRVDQLKARRSGASEPNACAASGGFFVNGRTLVAMRGSFCLAALRRKCANVFRISVLALFA